MIELDFDSIMNKVEAFVKTPKMQKRMRDEADKIMLGKIGFSLNSVSGRPPKTPKEAASKFCETLVQAVNDCIGSNYATGELSQSAATAVKTLEYNEPYKIGERYYIDLYFSCDKHRESLVPDDYSGVNNIVALLNSGYSAGHAVYGVWKGHTDDKIASLTNRGGAHFIEQAVKDFMGNYGADYGVLGIEVSEEYK